MTLFDRVTYLPQVVQLLSVSSKQVTTKGQKPLCQFRSPNAPTKPTKGSRRLKQLGPTTMASTICRLSAVILSGRRLLYN